MASSAEVVAMAKKYLGIPYVFGGTDPKKGLDCSSLVQLVYKNLGMQLPRLVRDQRNQGRAVNGIKNAQPGDLIVFGTQPSNYHIGIYLGGNKMLHAPQPGEKVKIGNVYETPTTIRRLIGDGGAGQDLSGTPAAGSAGAAAEKPIDMNTLASNYGYSVAFFKQDKSLWDLINLSVKSQFTPLEFQAQLKNTSWYKKHSESYRLWSAQERVDPASAQAKLHQTKVRLIQMGQQLGINVDPKRLADMAWRVNAYAWSDQEISAAMAGEMKFDPKKAGKYYGGMAVNDAKIKEQAAAYGVTVDDKTAFNLMNQLVGQQTTEEGVTAWIQKLAKSKYQGLADDIDAGMTVAEYADPFIQAQARLLEVDPADVHLDDKHIQTALQNKDQKTGAYAPKNMFDFEKQVKSDARWTKTKNGRDELMEGAQRVLADWGLSTTGGG
jgi:hypothetical protein